MTAAISGLFYAYIFLMLLIAILLLPVSDFNVGYANLCNHPDASGDSGDMHNECYSDQKSNSQQYFYRNSCYYELINISDWHIVKTAINLYYNNYVLTVFTHAILIKNCKSVWYSDRC